jgi:ketosteroid isomerase-like protein
VRSLRPLALLLGFVLGACGGATTGARVVSSSPEEERAIAAVLDDWHDAAAHSDEARYFGHFAPDGIFMGTDATERWDVAAFRAYSHRPFSEGRGWVMRATRRSIRVEGDVAFFDEDLETVNLGPARGTGVLLRQDGPVWCIAHYSLTITVPNERFDAVRSLLASPSAGEERPE